eukprot:358873-Chlamydomonas_euryale.AAC.3
MAAAMCPAYPVHAPGFQSRRGCMLGVEAHGRVESFVAYTRLSCGTAGRQYMRGMRLHEIHEA